MACRCQSRPFGRALRKRAPGNLAFVVTEGLQYHHADVQEHVIDRAIDTCGGCARELKHVCDPMYIATAPKRDRF